MRKVLKSNYKDFFNEYFEPGEICTYDMDQFLYSDIKKFAIEANVEIEYLGRNFPERGRTYDYAFRIVKCHKVIEEIKAEVVLFDINQLDL